MMNDKKTDLYFLRHGKADWPNWKKPDDERPLTKAGRQEVDAVGRLLVRLKIEPDIILTSPLPRAAQTAEIVAKHFKMATIVEKLLAPGFNQAKLARLQKKYGDRSLLLVGHEDDFSLTIGRLTNGRVKVAKAGFARVELDAPDRGTLRWLLPPGVTKATR